VNTRHPYLRDAGEHIFSAEQCTPTRRALIRDPAGREPAINGSDLDATKLRDFSLRQELLITEFFGRHDLSFRVAFSRVKKRESGDRRSASRRRRRSSDTHGGMMDGQAGHAYDINKPMARDQANRT
jgi:hypothetical protein